MLVLESGPAAPWEACGFHAKLYRLGSQVPVWHTGKFEQSHMQIGVVLKWAPGEVGWTGYNLHKQIIPLNHFACLLLL